MQLAPLMDVRQGATRQAAIHPTSLDLDRYLKVAIDRMEMCWTVLTVIHGDHDTEEPTKLGHP